mgnify:CR=1 FL=1
MSVPPAILPETTCILKSGKMESVPMRLDILKRKNKKGYSIYDINCAVLAFIQEL